MAVVEVIKYTGSPDVFAWKYPSEELGTWTQLIVNESQEALLFKGGRAFDLFGPGRHTLSTANIPLLSEFIKLPFGGRSPFAAEVWYVNRQASLDVKWGTPTPIQLSDPKYHVFLPVTAYGQFGVRIVSTKDFLIKLVGTLPTLTKDDLVRFFRGVYLTETRNAISSYLVDNGVSILEINAHLVEISDYLAQQIRPILAEYGIDLINFYVNDIGVPESDEAVKKLKTALSKKAEMNIIGYNYRQERSFNTLEAAAANEGAGQSGLLGAGLGLGMGVSMGTAVGGQFGTLATVLDTSTSRECPKCHTHVPDKVTFCPECGNDLRAKESESIQFTCTNCNATFPNAFKFCPECGMPRPQETACPQCGHPVEATSKFCPECGASLQQNPSSSTTADSDVEPCTDSEK
ncbi:MAG: SPFH domain-containing protein [Coriobacteriia bacterium]